MHGFQEILLTADGLSQPEVQDTRSRFAPEHGVRYDGIYRIASCWRTQGRQGKLMCRYLFVRCDNAAPPWSDSGLSERCECVVLKTVHIVSPSY